MINYKEELRKIGLGFTYVIGIWWIIKLLQPTKWGVIGLICLSSALFSLTVGIFDTERRGNLWKSILRSWVFIIIVVHIIEWVKPFLPPAYSFIIICLFIAGIMLVSKRKKFFEVKHQIEQMIWGKPLYKYRKKGVKPPAFGSGMRSYRK